MSSEIKRKLYDLEVDPPGSLWQKIATVLDEEASPELSKKLYDLEVPPPSNTWEKIKETLEEEKIDEYPARLHDLEVTPPAGTWNQIAAELDAQSSLPRINSNKRIITLAKYAVAASVLIAMVFGTVYLFRSGSSGEAMALIPLSARIDSGDKATSNIDKPLPGASATTNNLPKERTFLARANTTSKKRSLIQQAEYVAQTSTMSTGMVSASSANFQQASLRGTIPGSDCLVSDGDRYMTFMNPDGYLIRISKKLGEALGCYYSNGNSKEYKNCQDQIKKWREKIAQSPTTSSPDNFMDILNIIKSAQEEL